jgi:hypothetical protein
VVCIVEDFADLTQAEERNPIAMSIPATMRALQQTSLNGPQDLRLITDAPVPVPGPDEVLIQKCQCPSPGLAGERGRNRMPAPLTAASLSLMP